MERFKKTVLPIIVIFVGFVLSGCAAMSNSLKSIYINTDWEKPALTADLDVSPNKIVGIATGRKDKLKAIEKTAILDGLVKYNAGKLDKDIADLIVEPTYFYEYDGFGGVKVTVIGYPAKYKNFRMIEKTPIILNDAALYTLGVIERHREKRYSALLPDRLRISPTKLEFVWAF